MYGRITKFRKDIGAGVIVTNDGEKFRFRSKNVVNANGKWVGHEVDFLANTRQPKEIVVLTGSPWSVFQNSASSTDDNSSQ